MNCFSDLVLSADLVRKYKHVLPIFRIPGTDSFIEDPEFNVMMAINLDEHRDLDRWARRSNLLRNICFGRIFARHRAGRPTGRLFEYVDKNPEQQEHPNVSDEQLRTIVRGGLRDGGGMIEGVDFNSRIRRPELRTRYVMALRVIGRLMATTMASASKRLI